MREQTSYSTILGCLNGTKSNNPLSYTHTIKLSLHCLPTVSTTIKVDTIYGVKVVERIIISIHTYIFLEAPIRIYTLFEKLYKWVIFVLTSEYLSFLPNLLLRDDEQKIQREDFSV